MNVSTPKYAVDWTFWSRLFAARRGRPLPDPFAPCPELAAVSPAVARSLAVFQLGESGGGAVVEQARRSNLPAAGEHYAGALALFVAEEHRHAELLACGVRMLGGRLLRRHRAARLFRCMRRLMGLRLKIAVLLVAEVIGHGYYALLARKLPRGPLADLLREIAGDERSHLDFHAHFLRAQVRGPIRRMAFRLGWRCLITTTALVVLVDHRRAFRDLGIPLTRPWRLWWRQARTAEYTVCGGPTGIGAPVRSRGPAGRGCRGGRASAGLTLAGTP